MNFHGVLEWELLESYRRIGMESEPEWAVHKRNSDGIVKATIPFVGKHYAHQPKKILVYASAENLAGYRKSKPDWWAGDPLDNDMWAENRHRKCFDGWNKQEEHFFPNVHIAPMNDGRLATAAYYVAWKLYGVDYTTPKAFYETISFANYGKYSIETEKQRSERIGLEGKANSANQDYAGNRELLAVSHGYIQADLEMLKPDCIIMPKTMYWADKLFLEKHKGDAIIVPISQMNVRVINCHIARMYDMYQLDKLPRSMQKWYENIEKNGKYLSVFSYLDDVIENEIR